jgi:hypothetical protein
MADAQLELSILYLEGIGVENDNAEGFKWVLLASSAGAELGEKVRTYCEENLHREVLIDGRRRAEEFLKLQSASDGV